jgi:hypothetical protein
MSTDRWFTINPSLISVLSCLCSWLNAYLIVRSIQLLPPDHYPASQPLAMCSHHVVPVGTYANATMCACNIGVNLQ